MKQKSEDKPKSGQKGNKEFVNDEGLHAFNTIEIAYLIDSFSIQVPLVIWLTTISLLN